MSTLPEYHNRDRECNGGFSLIEVALALMVVSIGLVSLVSLMPASLTQNKKAIDDTQMALMGENILNGYRAQLVISGWSKWQNISLPPTAGIIWDATVDNTVSLGSGTNIYRYMSYQNGENVPIEDVAAQYELDVDKSNLDPNLLSCRLSLMPGQHGARDELIFYTEIFNTDLEWK